MIYWLLIAVCIITMSSCDNTQDDSIVFSQRVYLDPDEIYTIDSFKTIPFGEDSVASPGLYKGAVWIKMTLTNKSALERSFVICNNERLNRTYRFYIYANEHTKPEPLPQRRDLSDARSFNFPKANFSIRLGSRETKTFLMQVTSDGRALDINTRVYALEDYLQNTEIATLRNFFFYGSTFIILLINIFFWVILKKRIYRYYNLYLVTTCFFYLGLEGYLFDRGLDNHIVDHILFMLIRLWFFSLLSFTLLLFESKKTAPRFFRFARIYMLLALGLPTLYQFIFPVESIGNLHPVESKMAFVSLSMIILTVVFSSKRKRQETKYYIIALCGLLLFAVAGNITGLYAKFPVNVSTFLQIGAFFEFAVFTYTIVIIIRKNEKERENLEAAIVRLEAENRFNKTDLTSMLKLLEENITNDKDWDNFKRLYQGLDPRFFANIQHEHPELSKSEMRLVTLIKIGFNQKEMSNILGIAVSSVKKGRHRLRKKLNVPDGTVLTDYVSRF